MNTTATIRQNIDSAFLRRLRAALPAALRGAVAGWLDEQRQRRLQHATYTALAGLEPHILRDIGIDPSEIHSIAHAIGRGDATRIHAMHSTHRKAGL